MQGVSQEICNQPHELAVDFEEIEHNERRTLWVVLLTSAMMVVEIFAGYATGSMALLADGYHMASHAGALGISYLVYRMARSKRFAGKLNFGTGKLLPLGGYTSAIGLGIIALWMAFESVGRILNPVAIEFNEAILIAVVGLLVNIASAAILGFHSHGHDHGHGHGHGHHNGSHSHAHGDPVAKVEDHNHRSALLHVLADALTSVTAIFALLIGKFYDAVWLDPLMGVIGSIVILRWAYTLCRDTAWELLDGYTKALPLRNIREQIEKDGHRVLDLHAWNSGPSNVVCILSVIAGNDREDFRRYFAGFSKGLHLVVERTKWNFLGR